MNRKGEGMTEVQGYFVVAGIVYIAAMLTGSLWNIVELLV